ncbi:methyl-accepting chemotaxis protein [Fluviispira sanaruensis]|uniref:Methyl-accepting chemotaxis protein n=1 Tax=Fluviispira sanaruensis TaxID=2493639 RepID=A0A4P2VPZ6_FLUSA|nr:methyl-accepting chemotaxis protein [Fluviispira sanaruensis]BBH53979.1 methyl-accepting chemotaxis protein [Fluviispira sanaruensis]
MNFKKIYFSMRFKIISSLLIIIFTLCFVSIYQQLNNSKDIMKKMEYILESESLNLGNAIAAQFYERYGDVQAFAINPVFAENDRKKMQEALNQYSSLYGIYDVILYVDIHGNYIASNSLSPKGKEINNQLLKTENYAKEKWFQNVLMKKFTEDSEKKFQGTYFEGPSEDPIVSKVFGDHAYTTSFSAPVYDKSKKIIGIITNRANFSYLEDELIQVYKKLSKQGYSKADISLLDANGFVISEYDPSYNTSTEVKRDFNVLNKYNFFEQNSSQKELFNKTGMGITYSYNLKKNYDSIGGYALIDSPKWIPSIGWTVLIRSNVDFFFSHIYNLKYKFIMTVLALGLLSILIGFIIINAISNKFINISEHLKISAAKTFATANNIAISSETVANSTNDQSDAMQQSVSAMSEISSMITQTVEHVKDCSIFASTVQEKTDKGNLIMDKLTNSMESIQNANTDLQNMPNIITEVANKTSIINEIVFKTQLLSINASIEAARAGQHGKGFSVVAEEVGNLALTSGNAAKEIQILLQDSHNQVSRIIEITSKKIVDAQSVSYEAAKEFVTISQEIQSINDRLKGITLATKEQQIGVQQVVKAMSKMDQATKQNNSSAFEAKHLAKELKNEGMVVEKIMKAIQVLILGNFRFNHKTNKQTQLIDNLSESWEEQVPRNNNEVENITNSNIEVNNLIANIEKNVTKSQNDEYDKNELTAEHISFKENKHL